MGIQNIRNLADIYLQNNLNESGNEQQIPENPLPTTKLLEN